MKFLGWILRIVIVALGIALFVLQSQYAKKYLLEFVINQPFKDSSLKLEVEGIRGLFPFQFEVSSLELKDNEERLASLSNISVVWYVPALLAQEVNVNVSLKGLEGNITYKINKHALFSKLHGDGLSLWNESALTSIVVDLPELKLVRGKVSAILHDGQEPMKLTMDLEELDRNRLKIRDIVLAGKKIDGQGQAVAYLKQDLWEGEMVLSIATLADFDHWFEKRLGGSAVLTYKKKTNGQSNLDCRIDQFHYGDIGVKSLRTQAHFDEKNRWKFTLHGQDALVNAIPLTNLSATGTLDHGQGTFDVIGKGPKDISFQTQGVVDLPTEEVPQTEITLKRAELTHPMHQFSLKQPATLFWGEEGIRTQKVWLTAGTGTLTIQGLVLNQDLLSGDVSLDRLPLTFLRVINPDWIATGYLSGKGKLKGTSEKPDVELLIEGKSLQWGMATKSRRGAHNKVQGIDLTSTFKLSQGFLAWQVKMASGQMLSLTSQGKLFVNQGYPTAASSLEGVLKGQADMEILSHFIANGDLIQGQASLNLTISGTVQGPVINGHVSVVKGLYENAAFGTLIRNIDIQGKANNDVITVSRISGQDNGKGRVNGHCTVKLTSLLNPEVDLQLTLDKLIILQNDELSGKASGVLKLQGSLFGEELKQLKITGDVVIQPLEIRLEDHSEKIVTIKLLEKKKNGTYETLKEHLHRPELQKSSSFLPLDIKLSSPGEIYLRGYGFDAKWKGEMRAIGGITDPQLVGEITLVHGKFELLGKPLKLDEGRIVYAQEPKNDPLLTIVGSREVSEITATMRIEGHASDPKITFMSSPALPQEEVLARLLFGRGVESMSVTQSLLLANALSTFKGNNNLNFTNKIRSAFGLDVLEFKERKSLDGDDFKSPSQLVSVGKQISDKVYLSLDQSVSGDGGTSATVQFDVTSNLKLEADVGGETNTGVGFAWVKKY